MSNLPANAATEIATKRVQWGNLGELIYKKDFEFQARAQALIATVPADFKDISARSRLCEIGNQLKTLVEDRMKITNPLNAKMGELMNPEKAVKDAIDKGKIGLLTAKTAAAKTAADTKAKADELTRIREAISNYMVQMDAKFKNVIVEQVAFLFKEALDKNVSEAELPAWIQDKKLLSFSESSFTVVRPNIKPNLNTPEDVQLIWDELSTSATPARDYQVDFYRQLDEKFGFYSISLKNKEAAIQQAEAVVATAKNEISAEASVQVTANKLSSMAIPSVEVSAPAGRSLKQTYEIDVPDTEHGAILIMSAYVANLAAVRGGTRVTSYRKLTVAQMAAALVCAKGKDERFAPQGINFTSKAKL